MTDGSGLVQFGTGSTPGYDDTGHVLSVLTTYTGLPTKTLSYAYYPNGSRQSMTTPAGVFAYRYDGDGRLSSLTNPFSETSQWAYRDNGWLSSQTLGNGASTVYTQNALGQLTDMTTQASGTTLSEFGSMTYDGVGNRTAITASVPVMPSYSGATTYQYDPKDQLTNETSQRGSGYSNGFAYDLAGNPTTSRSSGPNSFNTDNQITGSGYTYDGNGNPTTYKGTTVAYDAADNPTTFGTKMTAGYTGSGLRAWKQGAGGRTYFLYDDTAPVCELDSTGNVTATNTFAGAGLLSRHTSAGSTFYTFDERGNVAQRLDATGSPLSSAMYDAYGGSASIPTDPFGFGGQVGYYTDVETGLQLCQHRYYDSSIGRFLSVDPIQDGDNWYKYANNNPLRETDPQGLNAAVLAGTGGLLSGLGSLLPIPFVGEIAAGIAAVVVVAVVIGVAKNKYDDWKRHHKAHEHDGGGEEEGGTQKIGRGSNKAEKKLIKQRLKEKLGRKPTDQEVSNAHEELGGDTKQVGSGNKVNAPKPEFDEAIDRAAGRSGGGRGGAPRGTGRGGKWPH